MGCSPSAGAWPALPDGSARATASPRDERPRSWRPRRRRQSRASGGGHEVPRPAAATAGARARRRRRRRSGRRGRSTACRARLSARPSRLRPSRSARRRSSALQRPSPVSGSGVRLRVNTVPTCAIVDAHAAGAEAARRRTSRRASSATWQRKHVPDLTTYSPRCARRQAVARGSARGGGGGRVRATARARASATKCATSHRSRRRRGVEVARHRRAADAGGEPHRDVARGRRRP